MSSSNPQQSNGYLRHEKNNRPNVKFSWRNISVWLKNKKNGSFWSFGHEEYVKVIHNVSGVINSGTLLAVMGKSGSGKTTFLTVLSQRTEGVVVGELLVNNKQISREQMKNISGFLPQRELVTDDLTVTERLQLMARLKMKESTGSPTRSQTILNILNQLGMTEYSQSKISVLSGGELKKVSLAEQLLTNPLLLFCDEPTTGLDSYNAQSIIKILKQIAASGKAVICTIHQPASGIFDIFHQVIFLARGNLMYHGPTEKVASFFESLGLNCPIGYNPVEYYISQIAIIENDALKMQKISDCYNNSKVFVEMQKQILNGNNNIRSTRNSISKETSLIGMDCTTDKFKKKPNFFVQFYWLLWLNSIKMRRTCKDIVVRFLFYMFIALLLSTMYWNIAHKMNQEFIQNLEGLILLIITETIFTFAYSVFHTFPSELPKLLREISDGLYSPAPYYLSKIVSLTPLIIMQTLIYSGLIFWSVGLADGLNGFIYFYIPILFCAFSSVAYGFALSTTFESIEIAALVSVPIDFLGMTYSGVYLKLGSLPWYTSWIPYASQFYYGIEAISVILWKKVDMIACEDPELPCVDDGLTVLKKYGFQDDNYVFDLMSLVIYTVLCHIIAFLSFNRRCNKQPVY